MYFITVNITYLYLGWIDIFEISYGQFKRERKQKLYIHYSDTQNNFISEMDSSHQDELKKWYHSL